jgi:7-carboxy-7-deazaguanine synthase
MNETATAARATDADSVVVHEIYRSIQGESSQSGLSCAFVRLSGCNLRCRWCDTPQAFEGGRRMRIAEVLGAVQRMNTALVEVTGGEPLLQPGARPLLAALCATSDRVLLETSGERDISGVDPRVHRIVDIKTPSSGESHRVRWENLDLLTPRDEVKLVLLDRADYEWAREVVARERLERRAGQVLLSPVHGRLDPRELVGWVLEDGLRARVQLQLHKYIWEPGQQGV